MNSGCSESCGTGGVLGGGGTDDVVPPEIAAFGPLDGLTVALDDDDVGDGVPFLHQGLIDCRLEEAGLSAPVGTVSGDDQLGLGVVDAAAQGVSREAAENH